MFTSSALSLSANTGHLWPPSVGLNIPAGGGSFVVEYKSDTDFRGDNVSVTMHDGQDFILRKNIGGPQFFLQTPDLRSTTSPVTDSTTDFNLSSFDEYDNQKYLRRYMATGSAPTAGLNSKVNGIISNNRLRSIKVSNCDGPIYIRGFIVDAASGTGVGFGNMTDWGIKVNNTEGLVVEDCGVARAYNGGLLVNNSNITLNRKFFAGRNYKGNTDTERYGNESCGIKALNSTITLSSNDTFAPGKDTVFACYQHHYGIDLKNSTITGGTSNTEFKVCYSMSAGIRMVNSNIEMDGTLDVYTNRVGIDSKDSELVFDKFVCQYNQEAGIRARNSHIYYGKNEFDAAGASYPLVFGFDAIPYLYGCSYFGNGKHLDLVNSFYEPVIRPDMEGTHANNIFIGCNGSYNQSDPGKRVGQSGVVLVNSKVKFLNTKFAQGFGADDKTIAHLSYNFKSLMEGPVKGVFVNATSNSEVAFIGTQYMATGLIGDRGTVAGSTIAGNSGVYANASVVKFSGPTAMYQCGIGVHVDNGSTLEVSPQKRSDGAYDALAYNLTEGKNHTSLEVHSMLAGLVATRNSNIILRDLGNARNRYPITSTQFSSSDYAGYDAATSALFNNGGCVFLPNNSVSLCMPGQGTSVALLDDESVPTTYRFTGGSLLNGHPYNYYKGGGGILTNGNWSNHLSNGGIAVMATDNSNVDVVNVCFHSDHENKDGIFLENDALNKCNHLVIWALARGSSLHAAHLAVSGAYPSEPGYTGPTATYFSGLTYTKDSALYGVSAENNLSSGLSDTSTLSILDFFGSGVQVSAGILSDELNRGWSGRRWGLSSYYGASSFENAGLFRLYFDTESHARNLVYLSGTGATLGAIPNDNRPWQVMAQGYMLSGPCSSVDISYPISITESLIYNYDYTPNSFQTSGYYHTKDAVKTDCTVLLDETAANTFANAKHCATKISERPKLVDIYKSTLTKSGDFFNAAASGVGIRTQRINDPRRTN